MAWKYIWMFALAWILLCMGVQDARERRIPSVYPGLLCATAVTRWLFLPGNLIPELAAGMSAFAGGLILYMVTGGKSIGAGDIRLVSAAALFLGGEGVLYAVLTGCLLALMIHGARMLLFRAGKMLALGPYLGAGIWMTAFVRILQI